MVGDAAFVVYLETAETSGYAVVNLLPVVLLSATKGRRA